MTKEEKTTFENKIIEFGNAMLKLYEESLKVVDEDKKVKLYKDLKEYQALPENVKKASLLAMMLAFSTKVTAVCDNISQSIEVTLNTYNKEVADDKNLN